VRAQFLVQVVFQMMPEEKRSKAVDENAAKFAHDLARPLTPLDGQQERRGA
jgi:hypothetical protein